MAKRLVTAIAVLFLTAALVGAAVFAWGYRQFNASGPLTSEVTLIFPAGEGLQAIAKKLHESGVIAQPRLFTIGVRLSKAGQKLKAGEYLFPPSVSPRGVMEILLSGKTVQRRLTVAEGLTSAQVVALLQETKGLQGELTVPPEGTLLPETYHFSYGDSRAGLVGRMRQAMELTLSELWRERALDLPLKSPAEALVLASIVEKETALGEERARIAGVFVNRLRRGMRLQSDPTVAYGLAADGLPLSRPLTRKDLKTPTDYNTYLIPGLPPTPIANPGPASIAAAMNPADTKELYFVADGKGGHAFAVTLKEHNRNVRRWRRIQRERGEASNTNPP